MHTHYNRHDYLIYIYECIYFYSASISTRFYFQNFSPKATIPLYTCVSLTHFYGTLHVTLDFNSFFSFQEMKYICYDVNHIYK